MKITKRQLKRIIREAILEENLWDNIRKKRARGEKPAKPGDEDYPDEKAWQSAQEADEAGGNVFAEADAINKDKMKCNKKRYLRKGE